MNTSLDRPAPGLSIAEVAARTGVSAHTLRYYERIGLITPVARAPNGHRRYAAGDVDWVRLLSCLRETGMGISDLQRFVADAGGEVATAHARLGLLEAHANEVRALRRRLDESLRLIDAKIDRYRDTVHAASEPEETP